MRYYLDVSAEAENKDGISLRSAKLILEFNCGKIDSDVFTNLQDSLLEMSANGRRWFIRYLLRTPRNGINRGTVAKIMAQYYKKKVKEVKKHLNFNSIEVVCSAYERGIEPMQLNTWKVCSTYVSKGSAYE